MLCHAGLNPFLHALLEFLALGGVFQEMRVARGDDVCAGKLGGLRGGVDAYYGCVGDFGVGKEDGFEVCWGHLEAETSSGLVTG